MSGAEGPAAVAEGKQPQEHIFSAPSLLFEQIEQLTAGRDSTELTSK